MNITRKRNRDLTMQERIKRDVKMYFEPISWTITSFKTLVSSRPTAEKTLRTRQSNTSKIEVLGSSLVIVLATSNSALANTHPNPARDLSNASYQTRSSKTLATEKLTAISGSVINQAARRKHA